MGNGTKPAVFKLEDDRMYYRLSDISKYIAKRVAEMPTVSDVKITVAVEQVGTGEDGGNE